MTTESGTPFDPAAVLDRIGAATEDVLRTADRLTDADMRAPSPLPGWSRGHVLTHLARNADGGRRLLTWARTGVETPEYPSLAARAEEIEAGAGRTAAELAADVRDSAGRFAEEYQRMPAEGWSRTVRWTRGQEHPAARAADARLCEVLVHHVDLDAGYTPAEWPADFVHPMLARVVAAFGSREDAPAVRLRAVDTGARYGIRTADPAPVVEGTASLLLAWLMGRSAGAGLTVLDGARLPEPPSLF
ncbi:maleylpyruvate isomerase family mycothiol-dependent enzyme [Actinacidiphila acidipaludis]|uniref:Maleylpyruvate isomerase family mycothiol-dependent enzyme n=1 Tax=Actinacidiphila acidipaludis TaxID=2873382 RepID=A0ABS7QGH4_9ACTN|nr:maleylpyruvate isomerase family mycothiol-dependent enzyme [Streptomyces acidipaludis]MBY8882268.1 maleylpyruvate isomerase family mycothiol-dependent enzyme [Streptomyces acidipaludis]